MTLARRPKLSLALSAALPDALKLAGMDPERSSDWIWLCSGDPRPDLYRLFAQGAWTGQDTYQFFAAVVVQELLDGQPVGLLVSY